MGGAWCVVAESEGIAFVLSTLGRKAHKRTSQIFAPHPRKERA
jgi:hypothetical protein